VKADDAEVPKYLWKEHLLEGLKDQDLIGMTPNKLKSGKCWNSYEARCGDGGPKTAG
jgi:hypothetical protein